MALYKNILKQAWEITLKYKYLWFFGLFATLLGGSGEYEVLTRDPSPSLLENFSPGLNRLFETGVFKMETLSNIGSLFTDDPLLTIMLLLMVFVVAFLAIFLLWLSIVSQIALVKKSVQLTGSKKTSKKFSIQGGIEMGMNYFWPVFGLNVFIKLIIAIAFALTGIPVVAMAYKTGGGLLSLIFLGLFIIFIPTAIILSFIMRYAICYIVIKDEKFSIALGKSWKLFKENWLVSIEMALVLFAVTFLAALVMIIAMSLLVVPISFLAMLLYNVLSFAGFWFVFVATLIMLLIIAVLTSSIVTTFQTASWSLLFVELDKYGATSKLVRMFAKKE